MYKYIKKILFSLLILMMPYMNISSKSMDIEEYDGSTVRSRKTHLTEANKDRVAITTEEKLDDFRDVLPFSKPSISSVNFEDSPISWTSYFISRAKMAIQGAYDVINFTTQNPRKTMIIGAILTSQIVSVAANCQCVGNLIVGCGSSLPPQQSTFSPNATYCQRYICPQVFGKCYMCRCW